jgi:hypothetical protein
VPQRGQLPPPGLLVGREAELQAMDTPLPHGRRSPPVRTVDRGEAVTRSVGSTSEKER